MTETGSGMHNATGNEGGASGSGYWLPAETEGGGEIDGGMNAVGPEITGAGEPAEETAVAAAGPECIAVQAQKDRQKKPPLPAGRADKWAAVWMFLVAYMAVEWFWIGTNHAYYGLGVFLYTMVYGLTVLTYAVKSGHRLKAEGIFWFAVMGLCGFSYVWVYNHSLMMFLALFLRLVSLYFTAVVLEVLIDGKTGDYFIVDSYLFLVLVPFKNFSAQMQVIRQRLKKLTLAKEILYGLTGCLAAIPLLAVIIGLLSGADDNFADILSNGFWYLLERWGHFLWTGVLAVPVSAYLYGQMYGCVKKRGTDAVTAEKVRKDIRTLAVVPMAGMIPALVSAVILYLLFIGLQGSYYLDALRGVLPEGFTYSEYARQGFFELVALSVLNLGIICLAYLLYRRKAAGKKAALAGGFLKYYTVVISVLTLFLIATAMTKMYLYIQAYGLTPLRVIPSVFMAFLAMVFLLTAASRFVRVPVMRISVCVFAAGFTVMALCGMDGRIASYNLNRWQNGTLDAVPEETLVRGHLASVLPVYEVWKNGDDMTKLRMELVADSIYCDYISIYDGTGGFFYLNRERSGAVAALREMEESFRRRELDTETVWKVRMEFETLENPSRR